MLLVAFIITFLIILSTPLIWWYLTLAKYSCLKTVPGPSPLPIIGNANVIGTTTVTLLESFMELTRKYGSVIKIWLGPRLHLMVTKPEVVEYFLTSNLHLSKSDGYNLFKPWLGDGLIVSAGDKWRIRRKLITPTFHFKILEKFLDTFNSQLDILVENLQKEVAKNPTSIDLTYWVNLCSLDIICDLTPQNGEFQKCNLFHQLVFIMCCYAPPLVIYELSAGNDLQAIETAFGTALNAQAKSNLKYVEAVTGWLEIFTLRFFSSWMRNPILFRLSNKYQKYNEYLKILHDFAKNVISKRKEEFKLLKKGSVVSEEGIKQKAALLDMLLEVADDGKNLSDEDIREEVETFMFAGHDTTTTSICFVLYALAQNPDIQTKVYEELISVMGSDYKQPITYNQIQELTYLEIVIKEAHRIYPPVPLIERSLEEDCTVEGISIPKGTNISIFLYGMNHSSDVFPEPAKFNVDRFLPENQTTRHNFAYVPFSAGPRNCIGQRFALLELKTSLAKLLRCFEFDIDTNKPPEIGMCSVLKSKNGINLKLKKRINS